MTTVLLFSLNKLSHSCLDLILECLRRRAWTQEHALTVRRLTVKLLFSLFTSMCLVSVLCVPVFTTPSLSCCHVACSLCLAPVHFLCLSHFNLLCLLVVSMPLFCVMVLLFCCEFLHCDACVEPTSCRLDCPLPCLRPCHTHRVLYSCVCVSHSESVWILSQTVFWYLQKFLNHLIGSLRSNLLPSY